MAYHVRVTVTTDIGRNSHQVGPNYLDKDQALKAANQAWAVTDNIVEIEVTEDEVDHPIVRLAK